MAEEKTNYDMNMILFTQLILSFQASAMQQMGKLMNPFTQKIERNLSGAQMWIDMLAMIQEKTKGNLTDDESRLLERALHELRLNYIDEVEKELKKPKEKETTDSTKREEPTEAPKEKRTEEGSPEAQEERQEERPSETKDKEDVMEEVKKEVKKEKKASTKSRKK